LRHGKDAAANDLPRQRHLVTKRQQLCLRGNAISECRLCLVPLLDAGVSGGNVGMGIVCDVGHTMWPGEHGGTADALPVKCREPAAHAPRHRRDPSRLQLRDTVGLVVILSYLI
jgi:hypothetical protein